MDYRLALLLHVPLGLPLSGADLENLTSSLDLDIENPKDVVSRLVSSAAEKYIETQPDWVTISQHILRASADEGIRWSYFGQADYPSSWVGLSRRPAIFSYLGEPSWRDVPMIAVVGSRTPATDTLHWMQRDLGAFLKRHKVGVVSGGARGVDQWAHRLALDCGQPTVCILPSGLRNPYPYGRESLWREILAGGGCILSTCGLQEPMRKSFFHIRNRWIAGMAPVCFVAEANRRSGSWLTATLAFAENKEVCTLPVFPTATQGLGNLDLIYNGAVMLRDQYDLTTLWHRACASSRVEGLP